MKGIYGQLFITIVQRINSTIFKPKAKTKNSIGILDIFGFENFDTNRFVCSYYVQITNNCVFKRLFRWKSRVHLFSTAICLCSRSMSFFHIITSSWCVFMKLV